MATAASWQIRISALTDASVTQAKCSFALSLRFLKIVCVGERGEGKEKEGEGEHDFRELVLSIHPVCPAN
jgi:hypothetical protein